MHVIVLAKAPVPGRVKTRLCPPCSPEEAATLADAALRDTVDAAVGCGAGGVVVALEGEVPSWMDRLVEVVPQRGHGLDERLAAAFIDVAAPALLIGMDTPQLTSARVREGLDALGRSDAVLGLASDGGFWAVGLHRADPSMFLGIPMSTDRTGVAQRRRLEAFGLRVRALPILRDVDTIDDALAVAAEAPDSRFAAALASTGLAPISGGGGR
jgi:rSAM/selenodomain-associated transferase 1